MGLAALYLAVVALVVTATILGALAERRVSAIEARRGREAEQA